jgi:primosomal protein N' (replication factor Y)
LETQHKQVDPIILSVALPTPLRKTFDYLLPEATIYASLAEARELLTGARVQVSFARQTLIGFIVNVSHTSHFDIKKIKNISQLIDQQPLIPADLLKLCQRAANYYCHPLGEALSTATPALLRQGEPSILQPINSWKIVADTDIKSTLKRAPKQLDLYLRLQERQHWSPELLYSESITPTQLRSLIGKKLVIQQQKLPKPQRSNPLLAQQHHQLTDEQSVAVESINHSDYCAYLLYGITGSGKTEVYLQAIEETLSKHQQVLILVPEIGLTPQTIQRFQARFNRTVVAVHSNLNDKERCEAWLMAAQGIADIVIGTRSAIFTPARNLGLIIVDEEHDQSFKQQDGFRYNARDLAVMRAQQLNIPLILGSATPSMESFNNAQQQRYKLLPLTQRAGSALTPSMEVLDVCRQPLQDGLSPPLITAIQREIEQGNQVLVFLNRRGFAPSLLCHDCGWIAQCPRCDSRLTVHQSPQHLHCHHCDYQRSHIHQCPKCNSREVKCLGQGTERCEQALTTLFPKTDIIRVDRDSTRRKNSMKNILDNINKGDPCILVGTQMLAKGHHFADVTLVVILDADSSLFTADFRAPERFGQLLLQVSGRAGRAQKPGRVIIQSHLSNHPYLQNLLQGNYSNFLAMLEPERKLTQLPPYGNLALIRSESKRPENAAGLLNQLREHLNQSCAHNPQVNLLGPLPAPLEKRNDRYRFQLQINTDNRQLRHHIAALSIQFLDGSVLARRVRWSIDIDPQDMN